MAQETTVKPIETMTLIELNQKMCRLRKLALQNPTEQNYGELKRFIRMIKEILDI